MVGIFTAILKTNTVVRLWAQMSISIIWVSNFKILCEQKLAYLVAFYFKNALINCNTWMNALAHIDVWIQQ